MLLVIPTSHPLLGERARASVTDYMAPVRGLPVSLTNRAEFTQLSLPSSRCVGRFRLR